VAEMPPVSFQELRILPHIPDDFYLSFARFF
jgi:hypothetical protein